jgi:hypothetical protein
MRRRMRFIFTFENKGRLAADRIEQSEKKHTRVSLLLPDAARGGGGAPLSSFSFDGALSSLGLDCVSTFDGGGDSGDNVPAVRALVSACVLEPSAGGGA